MSDETRTPGPEEQASPPEEQAPAPTDRTEVIDVTPSSSTPAEEDHPRDWFDVPVPAHPSDGPGIPARADAAWGPSAAQEDRADDGAPDPHGAGLIPPPVQQASADDPGSTGRDETARFAPTQPLPHAGEPATSAPEEADGSERAPAAGQPQGPSGSATYPWMDQTVPLGPAFPPPPPPAAQRRQRGPLVALVLALCLVSGVIGGVAGQLLADRPLRGSTLPQAGPGATARPSGSIASIAAKALPSVVTIRVKGGQGDATGSGFVIDGKGHVLTNNHVVAAASGSGSIEAVLSNGDTEPATIVGRDSSYDLAVIKLSRTDLTPLVLGPSDQVVVGDEVIAVGAPLGLDQTVTSGIVSALNRPVTPGAGDEASYINAIQTDAAINPGNSGGPLLDMKGQVIGINSAIARVPGTTSSSSGNIGLGFAIPSDQARRTADQLIATGHATHPIIGVMLDRTFTGEGAEVSTGPDAVTSGGPADKAGIRPGDVVVGFEGKRIRTPDQLIVSIRARGVGDTVTLKVKRGASELDLKMTLEAAPSD
ncbi:MAG: trypsin-like peptidase domain-containing protein [Intrasporangium sp.]|uniref:S1C family serine protease n=1 Tax=Intrasporangium sp. TaxID=1925024 RepID=UPI003F7E0CAF